ncbi:MAG: hypothetical protein JXP34_00255 [Planctomycetes bacterium]|nr:hypothetical protein [Planctomycetota bacterium]
MPITRPILAVSTLSLALAAAARGDNWIVLGPRAMGMGGAGVAATRGSLATHWNPANLGIAWSRSAGEDRLLRFDAMVPASASVTVAGDVLKNADALYDTVENLDWDAIEQDLDDGGGFDTDNLQTLLEALATDAPRLNQHGEGLLGDAGGGLTAQVWRFGVSALAEAHAAGRTFADLSLSGLALGDEGIAGIVGAGNDRSGAFSNPSSQSFADSLVSTYGITQDQAEEFVYQAEQGGVDTGSATAQNILGDIVGATTAGGVSTDEFITNNDSGIETRSILMNQLGVAYAQPLFDGRVAAGVNLKLVYGITQVSSLRLRTLEDGSDVVEELFDDDDRKESWRFDVDAGVTVYPFDFLAVGVAGRHLAQPRFDAAGGDYEVDPQVRAGIALFPTGWLTLALDCDMTRNASEGLPGYASQVIGAGAEFRLFGSLALRAGVSKNLVGAESPVLHAGLGLDVWGFHLEAAGCSALDTQPIETDGSSVRIPEHMGASLLVGLEAPF